MLASTMAGGLAAGDATAKPMARGDDRRSLGLWLRLDRAGRTSVVTTVTRLGQTPHGRCADAWPRLDLPLAAVTVTHVPVEPARAEHMPPGITTFGSMDSEVRAGHRGPSRNVARHAAARRHRRTQWQVPLDLPHRAGHGGAGGAGW